MPYTRHGHWYGPGEPTLPKPERTARCGGTRLCPQCAAETVGPPARPRPSTRKPAAPMPVFREPGA